MIRVINGVKDMDGFRRTMNLSLVKDEQSNGSLNCGGTDTSENALLVNLMERDIRYMYLYSYAGSGSVFIFYWLFLWCFSFRRYIM